MGVPTAVLAATNLGPSGLEAVRRAAHLAGRWHAKLVVCHALKVWPRSNALFKSFGGGYLRRGSNASACVPAKVGEQLRIALDGELELETRVIVRAGDPRQVVLDVAREENANLIVVGAHAENDRRPPSTTVVRDLLCHHETEFLLARTAGHSPQIVKHALHVFVLFHLVHELQDLGGLIFG